MFPYAWLATRTPTLPAFSHDPAGHRVALRAAISTLTSSGEWREVPRTTGLSRFLTKAQVYQAQPA